MEPCIEVKLVQFGNNFGYDIVIQSKEATIADYIDAMDGFLEENVAPCIGCDSCCHERIPLTLADLQQYAGKEPGEISAFVQDYCAFEIIGPALDIRLKLEDNGACVFLNESEQKCNRYQQRSLVCHTYICIPQSERAAKLRSALVNQGEDALIGHLLSQESALELPIAILEKQPDYPPLPLWQNKNYEEIRLVDILPPDLWEALFQSCE